MRKISFILCILGMFALLSILLFQKPTNISNSESLSSLIPNTLIQVSGIVIQETIIKNSKILLLDNELKASCDLSCPKSLNKTVEIIGTYDDFYNQIKILEIKEK